MWVDVVVREVDRLRHSCIGRILSGTFTASLGSMFGGELRTTFTGGFGRTCTVKRYGNATALRATITTLNLGSNSRIIIPTLAVADASFKMLRGNSVPIFTSDSLSAFRVSTRDVRGMVAPGAGTIVAISLFNLTPSCSGVLSVYGHCGLCLVRSGTRYCLKGCGNGCINRFNSFSDFDFRTDGRLATNRNNVLLYGGRRLTSGTHHFGYLKCTNMDTERKGVAEGSVRSPRCDQRVSLKFGCHVSRLRTTYTLKRLRHISRLINGHVRITEVFSRTVGGRRLLGERTRPRKCMGSC